MDSQRKENRYRQTGSRQQLRWRLSVISGMAMAAALVGCAGFNRRFADFTPTASGPARAARQLEEVLVLFKPEVPSCEHHVVGLYQSGRSIPLTVNGLPLRREPGGALEMSRVDEAGG